MGRPLPERCGAARFPAPRRTDKGALAGRNHPPCPRTLLRKRTLRAVGKSCAFRASARPRDDRRHRRTTREEPRRAAPPARILKSLLAVRLRPAGRTAARSQLAGLGAPLT